MSHLNPSNSVFHRHNRFFFCRHSRAAAINEFAIILVPNLPSSYYLMISHVYPVFFTNYIMLLCRFLSLHFVTVSMTFLKQSEKFHPGTEFAEVICWTLNISSHCKINSSFCCEKKTYNYTWQPVSRRQFYHISLNQNIFN